MPSLSPRSRGAVASVLLAALTGCATGPSTSSRKAVNTMIGSQNYSGAISYLQQSKESQYGKKNMVLFYLDKGMVEHNAGLYKESDQDLDTAEKRMEELYTKSISQAAGMLILNDTTAEYAGEPFEKALTNVVRALNYVFLGSLDDALVESRKVELFLQELNDKLGKKTTYKDDAFARYLDALLYADEGKLDDARISMQAALQAYGWYASLYNTPTPHFDFPPDKQHALGELVFIHYNGVAPRKVSKTFQVAWGQAVAIASSSPENNQQFQNGLRAGILGNAITVAYPEYVQDPYTIVSSEVRISSEDAKASTILVEDISAIAARDLQDRNAVIRARAIARATVKYVVAEAASRAAAQACDRQYGSTSWQGLLCKGLARGVAHGVAAATEIADTRGWATLPSQIRMARLKLPPGKHDVIVDCKNAAGLVVSSYVFHGVDIAKGKRTYLAYRTAI